LAGAGDRGLVYAPIATHWRHVRVGLCSVGWIRRTNGGVGETVHRSIFPGRLLVPTIAGFAHVDRGSHKALSSRREFGGTPDCGTGLLSGDSRWSSAIANRNDARRNSFRKCEFRL